MTEAMPFLRKLILLSYAPPLLGERGNAGEKIGNGLGL